jgi:hypothetical protein
MATQRSTQRRDDLKRVAHLYDWVEPYGPDVCVYCGDLAFSRDHVTPVWYVASLGDLLELHMPRLRHGLLVVPACRDCNKRLESYVAFCVTDKRVELKKRLRRRWRRLLESYDWQAGDLAEMGPACGRGSRPWRRNGSQLWTDWPFRGPARRSCCA